MRVAMRQQSRENRCEGLGFYEPDWFDVGVDFDVIPGHRRWSGYCSVPTLLTAGKSLQPLNPAGEERLTRAAKRQRTRSQNFLI